MTRADAIALVTAIAERWGENAEEAFARRIEAFDSDEQCQQIAAASDATVEEVVEVRDLWRAVALLNSPEASTTCQHRDDGRGRCIDCGAFL